MQKITFDLVLPTLNSKNLKELYRVFSSYLHQYTGTPADLAFDKMIGNEENDSAIAGNGVLLAALSLPRLTVPFSIFGKLETPLEHNKRDGVAVDLFCLLATPEYESTKHLQTIAKYARFFAQENNRLMLREAEDREDIISVLKIYNMEKKAVA